MQKKNIPIINHSNINPQRHLNQSRLHFSSYNLSVSNLQRNRDSLCSTTSDYLFRYSFWYVFQREIISANMQYVQRRVKVPFGWLNIILHVHRFIERKRPHLHHKFSFDRACQEIAVYIFSHAVSVFYNKCKLFMLLLLYRRITLSIRYIFPSKITFCII